MTAMLPSVAGGRHRAATARRGDAAGLPGVRKTLPSILPGVCTIASPAAAASGC
jgi:hypothetical protein